ncbi:MAG: InlB B-repeat-containing protein, partial [Clostridia bacterium]|nr:InlB B-repeat-containing protein [Clostridia bacterium]
EYIVKYHFENVEDDNYTVDGSMTKTLQGTTDSAVSAETPTVEHFTLNEEKSTLSGTVKADCSLVLNVYYTRNTYKVMFEGNDAMDVKYGTTISAIDITSFTKPTKADADGYKYKFAKWVYEEDAKVTGNVTLTAEFTAEAIEYTISYSGIDDAENPNPTKYTVETETITLVEASKTGYSFLGWTDEDGKDVTEIAKGTTGDIVLEANWEIETYTITYDVAVDGNPDTYTVEDEITLSAPAVDFGKMFVGWYNANGEKVETIEVGTTGNIELTAKIEDYSTTQKGTNHYTDNMYDVANGVLTVKATYSLYDIENGGQLSTGFEFMNSEGKLFKILAHNNFGNTAALRLSADPNYSPATSKNVVNSTGIIDRTATALTKDAFNTGTQDAPFTFNMQMQVSGRMVKIWVGTETEQFTPTNYNYLIEDIYTYYIDPTDVNPTAWATGTVDDRTALAPDFAQNGLVKVGIPFCYTGTTANLTASNVEVSYVKIHNITYKNIDAGSNPVTYAENEEVILSAPKLNDGYEFKGWYDNAQFEGDPITRIEEGSTEDKEFYAKVEYSTKSGGVGYLTNDGYYDINAGTLTVRASYAMWAIEGINAKNLFGTGFQLKQEGTGLIFKIRTDYGITTTRRLKISAQDTISGSSYQVNSPKPINTDSLSGLGSDFSVGSETTPYELDMQMRVSGKKVMIWIGKKGATFTDTNYNYLIEDIYDYYTTAKAYSDANPSDNLYPGGTDAKRTELAPNFEDNGKVLVGIPFYYVGTSAGLKASNVSVTYEKNN